MRRTLAVMAVSALTLTLGACGGSDDGDSSGGDSAYADTKPEDILDDAGKALDGLKSVHLSGSLDDDGDEVTVDLTMDDAGACTGSLQGTLEGAEMNMEVLSDGDQAWVKFNEEFYDSQGAQGKQMKALIGDKWAAGQQMDAMLEICDISEFTDQIFEDDYDDIKVSGTDEVDGDEVVQLDVTDEDGETSTLSVLTSEPHLVVLATQGEKESLTLDSFDETVEVEAPDESEVVNLDQAM